MTNEEIILTSSKKEKPIKKKKQKLSKEEAKAAKLLKKEQNKAKRELHKKEKNENPENYYKGRRLFYGIGKESLRISWLKKHKILYYFLVVFFWMTVLALIFSAISIISLQFIPS